MKDFEKKVRIQLYDEEMNHLSDRLLGQDQELSLGPKETHSGPLKVEVCLFNKDDVDNFVEYLQRIQGDLPLRVVGTRGRKKSSKMSKSGNHDLVEELKAMTTGTEFYDFTTANDFIFTNYQLLQDLELPVKIPEEFQDSDEFRLLIRLTKKAKNPLNNKYDPTLLLVVPRKGSSIVRGFDMTEEILQIELDSLKVSRIKVSRSNLTKFPPYMPLSERNKFRIDRDKLIADPEAKPSRFYERWVHPINDINKGITFPRIDDIPKPY